ncbi:hypothetical protein MtrunA17_Chr5g0408011 [Medicago truncatula]|uniref:Uncharacterized protein n=1 Tax=Medicago truncatula TaxID=3880 RepID=A0A396HT14_MEDTR|nr:hypothetical protein MtrunA17_Chr5g0408011 [Medicago truncatula]
MNMLSQIDLQDTFLVPIPESLRKQPCTCSCLSRTQLQVQNYPIQDSVNQ